MMNFKPKNKKKIQTFRDAQGRKTIFFIKTAGNFNSLKFPDRISINSNLIGFNFRISRLF